MQIHFVFYTRGNKSYGLLYSIFTHVANLNSFKPEFNIFIFIHRNSRLVVDEDDLKWETNEKKVVVIKQFVLKTLLVGN